MNDVNFTIASQDRDPGTILLAHYYAPAAIRQAADFVGDSLELSRFAQTTQANRIVFAGVRFMAETAKLLNPDAEVLLPDAGSTCSLVEQTSLDQLTAWIDRERGKTDKPIAHVSYINSSVQHKAVSDWIVTSRNAEDIIGSLIDSGHRILFSPDRNMGSYFRYMHPEWDIKVWNAVCEVHDAFREQELDVLFQAWTDGPKFLLAHPESPLPILKRAHLVGSTTRMLDWVKAYQGSGTIYVATEIELINVMQAARPDLDIRVASSYTGCQCHACPYMKRNTEEAVLTALQGTDGVQIDYIDDDLAKAARAPILRMLSFEQKK
ncbi:quinolinate synthase [Sulfurirhabdus autotrophica]|uniref:quinolinate synthase n=1 Tax=Sulfurirhabdus autotrophica TaxID=1706046 RepID=A0A4R3XTG8_9PROT|nr:quinolinate synthase [Sulfurirhabdus autotrophica]TCV81227.1 quinolinate synthetase [Sulfurirhabdus autotrophica]